MFRISCRGKVKRILGLGVALLVIVQLVRITVYGGIRGSTEMDVGDVPDVNEKIWPPPSENNPNEKVLPFTSKSKDKVLPSTSKSRPSEKIWPIPKRWSNGLDEDIEEMGEEELQSEEEVADHGHAGSKKRKELEHPREKQGELTEEEELKFLGKLLARDDKLDPDEDKLTGSEVDGNPEDERMEKDEESEDEDGDDEKMELRRLEKMLDSDEWSDSAKIKQKNLEKAKPLTHNYNKAVGQVGVPIKHAANQAGKESKSIPKETEEFGKNTEEEEELPEQEVDGEQEENEEMEKPKRKSPQITMTSYRKDNSDDRIHVDTSRPILNRHTFRYLITAPDVCKGSKVFVVCYVHSAVQNYKRRKRIRRTWGNRNNYPGIEIRVVFFVGLPHLDTTDGRLVQQDLLLESKAHGDIVQEDFVDDHRNLSHKGVGALKWVSTYCNHAAYVLKTDDDMFVNMYVILNHLRNLHAANFRRRLMLCYVYWRIEVGRDAGVSKTYFPNNTYPPFCSGMGFVMTTDVAVALHEVSPHVRFFALNEVFIGGVLPAALHGAVNHTSWARTYCAQYEMGIYTHRTEWYKYTFTHTHDDKLIVKTWRGLSDIVRNRTIPRPSVIRPGLLADVYRPLSELFPPP